MAATTQHEDGKTKFLQNKTTIKSNSHPHEINHKEEAFGCIHEGNRAEPNQTQQKFTPCSNIYLMDENCLAEEQLANELFGNFWDYYWREESSETH